MKEIFSRTAMLIGSDSLKRLSESRVAVFGLGGVGGYVVEALCRSGIGTLDLIDSDKISESNINRQIYATFDNIGKNKVDVAEARCLTINPEIKINKYNLFLLPDTADNIDFSSFDYIVDAIDTVTAKILLAQKAQDLNIPIIASMGTGNKINPSMLKVADITKTNTCPLARVMRIELKKRGIKHLKCVYSEEQAITPDNSFCLDDSNKRIPGSISFVPSTAGLLLASEVIKDIINQ